MRHCLTVTALALSARRPFGPARFARGLEKTFRSNPWPNECLPRLKSTPQQCRTHSWSCPGTFSDPHRLHSDSSTKCRVTAILLQFMPGPSGDYGTSAAVGDHQYDKQYNNTGTAHLPLHLQWLETQWQMRMAVTLRSVDELECNQSRISSTNQFPHCHLFPVHGQMKALGGFEVKFPCVLGIVHPTDRQVRWGT